MKATIDSNFKGYINNVEVNSEAVHYNTEAIIERLEFEKGMAITDEAFTKDLVNSVNDFKRLGNGYINADELLSNTGSTIDNEPTLTEFHLFTEGDWAHSSVADEFRSKLEDGAYEYLFNEQQHTMENVKNSIESTFKGHVNGQEIVDENIYQVTTRLISDLEEKKGIQIDDPKFTADLIENISAIKQATEMDSREFDFQSFEYHTRAGITSESTLKDFKFAMPDESISYGYDYEDIDYHLDVANDFHSSLENGNYDYLVDVSLNKEYSSMNHDIMQDFKAHINGVPVHDKEVYYAAVDIISELEEKKGIEITDPKFTDMLLENMERLEHKAWDGQFDFHDLSFYTRDGITEEKTLKDFKLATSYGVDERIVEKFHTSLENGEYEYVVTGQNKHIEIDKSIESVTKDWSPEHKEVLKEFINKNPSMFADNEKNINVLSDPKIKKALGKVTENPELKKDVFADVKRYINKVNRKEQSLGRK